MTDPVSPQARPARWLVAGTLAVLGVLALALGIPRLMAGIAAGPQDRTLRELAAGKPIPAPLLARTAESRERATRWVPSGRYHSDIATIRMSAIAGTRPLSPERRALVNEAVAVQRKALARAPADAYGWNRLLQASAVGARPAGEIERIMDMAIRRAPAEPGVVMARLQVALLYWQGLSPGMRARLRDQFHLAALWMPSDLVRLARARFAEATVAEMLMSEPHLLARFNYARARL